MADAISELLGADDGGVGAPAQDPAFDFVQAVEAALEVGAAAGEFGYLLAGVPDTAMHEVGGPGIKFDDDFVVGVAAHDAEAFAKDGVGVEVFWFEEPLIGDDGRGDAAEGEGADVGRAARVMCEEVPDIIDAGEVIGMDVALLGRLCGGLAVGEFERDAFVHGAADSLENAEVGIFGRERAEGEGLVEIFERVTFFTVEPAEEFLEGHFQRALERGAVVLLDGFVGDQQGEEFGFGDADTGEAVNGFGEVIAVAEVVVFDGPIEGKAHEFDVALDRIAGDFESGGDGVAIRERIGEEEVVDFANATEGRAFEWTAT